MNCSAFNTSECSNFASTSSCQPPSAYRRVPVLSINHPALHLCRPGNLQSWRATPAMTANGGREEGRSFNPFRDRKKEDAAKKALQEMFQGKQDLLAAYDAGGGGAGKSRKGRGGGGGGDGDDGAFDWRAWLQDLLRGSAKTARSVAQALGALALLLAIFFGASLIEPAAAAAMAAVRWLLRLDGRGSRRARQPAPVAAAPSGQGAASLGADESSVIAKYGADDEDEEEE